MGAILREGGIDMGKYAKMTPEEIIEAIRFELSGTEWSSETMATIAAILVDNGYEVKDLDDSSEKGWI